MAYYIRNDTMLFQLNSFGQSCLSDKKYNELVCDLKEELCKKISSTGLRLDDFDLVKKIGTGSFSHVFYARLKAKNHFVALKCISKASIKCEGDIDMIVAEKMALKKTIESPYIVQLLSSFQSETYIFLVMEFLAGGNLHFHMIRSKNECFAVDQVCFYSAQVALALDFIHRQGIIYRDLKLSNIVLTPHGYIKLVDFGMYVNISF